MSLTIPEHMTRLMTSYDLIKNSLFTYNHIYVGNDRETYSNIFDKHIEFSIEDQLVLNIRVNQTLIDVISANDENKNWIFICKIIFWIMAKVQVIFSSQGERRYQNMRLPTYKIPLYVNFLIDQIFNISSVESKERVLLFVRHLIISIPCSDLYMDIRSHHHEISDDFTMDSDMSSEITKTVFSALDDIDYELDTFSVYYMNSINAVLVINESLSKKLITKHSNIRNVVFQCDATHFEIVMINLIDSISKFANIITITHLQLIIGHLKYKLPNLRQIKVPHISIAPTFDTHYNPESYISFVLPDTGANTFVIDVSDITLKNVEDLKAFNLYLENINPNVRCISLPHIDVNHFFKFEMNIVNIRNIIDIFYEYERLVFILVGKTVNKPINNRNDLLRLLPEYMNMSFSNDMVVDIITLTESINDSSGKITSFINSQTRFIWMCKQRMLLKLSNNYYVFLNTLTSMIKKHNNTDEFKTFLRYFEYPIQNIPLFVIERYGKLICEMFYIQSAKLTKPVNHFINKFIVNRLDNPQSVLSDIHSTSLSTNINPRQTHELYEVTF